MLRLWDLSNHKQVFDLVGVAYITTVLGMCDTLPYIVCKWVSLLFQTSCIQTKAQKKYKYDQLEPVCLIPNPVLEK